MQILYKVKNKVTQNTYLRYLWNKSKLIINIIPYYLVQEGLVGNTDQNLKPSLNEFIVRFLKPSDMKTISENPEVSDSEDILLDRLATACFCLGITYQDNIVSYVWCNLTKCESLFISFPLEKDEAYIFGARTFQAYRGKNLAPYLRYQLYEHLKHLVYTKFLSINEFFNIEAMKLNKKLKARPLKLYIYTIFLKKYRWNILLKNFKNNIMSYEN